MPELSTRANPASTDGGMDSGLPLVAMTPAAMMRSSVVEYWRRAASTLVAMNVAAIVIIDIPFMLFIQAPFVPARNVPEIVRQIRLPVSRMSVRVPKGAKESSRRAELTGPSVPLRSGYRCSCLSVFLLIQERLGLAFAHLAEYLGCFARVQVMTGLAFDYVLAVGAGDVEGGSVDSASVTGGGSGDGDEALSFQKSSASSQLSLNPRGA